MADIIQAAKWMQQGKRVTRSAYMEADDGPLLFRLGDSAGIECIAYGDSGNPVEAYLVDILADDWELAE